MSVRVMTLVWAVLALRSSDLTVLLALADWCDDDGGRLFPSMEAIARKARLSKGQARRVVHRLIADGWLLVLGNAEGGAPGTTRQYQVAVAKLEANAANQVAATASANATPTAIAGGSRTAGADDSRTAVVGARDGSRPRTPTAIAGDSQTVTSTTMNREARARGSRLPDDWTLPETWKAWAIREQPTWDEGHVQRIALNFGDYWAAKAGKDAVKLNWERTWQGWVRREGPKPSPRRGEAPPGLAWRSGGEPATVIHNALRKLNLRAWSGGETHGQARQRIIEAGGEELLRPPRVSVVSPERAAA